MRICLLSEKKGRLHVHVEDLLGRSTTMQANKKVGGRLALNAILQAEY